MFYDIFQNSGGARQSRLAPLGEVTGFIYDDAHTLYEMMQRGFNISGKQTESLFLACFLDFPNLSMCMIAFFTI